MKSDIWFAIECAKMRARNYTRLFQSLKHIYTIGFNIFQNVQIHRLHGVFKTCNQTTVMLFVGEEFSAHQFASLVYQHISSINTVRTCLFSHVLPLLESSKPGIVAVRVEKPIAIKFEKQGYLLLPNLSFSLDLRLPEKEIMERMSHRRRRDIKKVEALGYSYAISEGTDKDLSFFYWKMYLPHTLQRFGKSAYVKTFNEFRAAYKENGGLIFVKRDKKPVSGILFRVVGKTLFASSFGVFHQDENGGDRLASQSVLFFLIKWARERGFDRLDYGTSLPFFKEGVFSYKKEWGMNVGEPLDRSFCALKINASNMGSMAFLWNNPFIILDNDLLKGVVFLDHKPDEKEIYQLFSDYFLPTLSSIIFVACYKSSKESVDVSEFSNLSTKPLVKICQLLNNNGFTVRVFEVDEAKEISQLRTNGF